MRRNEQRPQDDDDKSESDVASSDSEDENEEHFVNSQHIQHTATELTTEIMQIFQQNIKEQKN